MSEMLAANEINANPHWESVYATVNELDISNDIHARANQVAMLTPEGIMDLATRLHTELAPAESHEPHTDAMKLKDPEGTVTAVLANPEDRPAIFQAAVSLVTELAARRTPQTDEAFLARSANVIGLAQVLAHTFSDGNGRTSRVMSQLVREGFDGSAKAQEELSLLGSNRPPSGFRINGTLPTKSGRTMSPNELLAVAASVDLPLNATNEYVARKNEHFVSAWLD